MVQKNKLSFRVNNNNVLTLLTIVNILFIVYFFTLAFYNRLSQDDFLFLKSIQNDGIINFAKGAYLTQSGRFVGYFLNSLIYTFIIKTGSIILIPVFVWILNTLILQYVLRKYIEINFFYVFNFSALLLNIFIITNFEFTAFYWTCAIFYYVFPILFILLFGLVNNKKVSKSQYVLLIFTAVIISGSSEVFIPFCILFLFFNLLYYYFKYNKDLSLILSKKRTKKLLVSIVILFTGLVFVLIAPGNYNRATESIFQQPASIIDFILITSKSFVLFFYLLSFKFPYYIVLILISFLVGLMNKESLNFKIIYRRFLLISWVGYLVFVLLSVMPAAFLMSGFGFQRIYTTTVFVSILFFIIQGFYFGLNCKKNINQKYLQKLIAVNLFLLIIVMCANLYLDVPTARKYAESDIKRTNYLLELKQQGNQALIELTPLYKPYTYNLKYLILRKKQPLLYYDNEISTDTSGYVNSCISSFYDLEFPIKLESSNADY